YPSRIVPLWLGRCPTHRDVLHELRPWKHLCARCLVLLPCCVSDQINYWGARSVAVESRGYCNSSYESPARDLILAGADNLLPDSCTCCWHEHRRASYPGRLRFSLRAYWRRRMGSDPEESQVDLCSRAVFVGPCRFIFNGFSQ